MANANAIVRPEPEMTSVDLARWRRFHYVTQEQLATTLGVLRHTVGRWETEERRMPGRWLYVALKALEQHPELWRCARCEHDGLVEQKQAAKYQGAPQTLYHFACPECGAIAYTA